MSHVKHLHNRRYWNDYLEMINRKGLPGNVKNELGLQVQDVVITAVSVALPFYGVEVAAGFVLRSTECRAVSDPIGVADSTCGKIGVWQVRARFACDPYRTGAPAKMRCPMSYFFTRTSHARLVEELTKLRTQDLPALSHAKLAAAAEGDLSENAEYHATREKLDMLQRRIYELEEQLRSPRLIEELSISCERVSIGTKVTCLDLATHDEVVYTILGPADAVPQDNVISYQSPLAQGLISKEIDDDVAIAVPSGTRRLRILDIQRFDEK